MFAQRSSFFGDSGPTRSPEAFAPEEEILYRSVELDERLDSTSAMQPFIGRGEVKNPRHVDIAEVIGNKVDQTLFSRAVLQLQFHEQLGRRYLFEARLNEMLSQGHNVNPGAAKEFLVGLLDSGKFGNLPVQLRTNLVKLSEIPAVRMEFANEKVSIFNPKPHGFDLNYGHRPS